MARKQILSSVRLDKKLSELKDKGYKLHQELLLCNKKMHFDESANTALRNVGADEEFLNYPLSRIVMSFVKEKPVVECNLIIEVDSSGLAKISTMESRVTPLKLFESKEKYTLYVGDEVPEYGLEGEPLNTFELVGYQPILKSTLKENEMLLGNEVLWSIFNNYSYRESASVTRKNVLENVDISYLHNIQYALDSSDFAIKSSSYHDGSEFMEYQNEWGTCFLNMVVGEGITMWYTDVFIGNDVPDTIKEDYKVSVNNFIQKTKYEVGSLAMPDVNSIPMIRNLMSWRYKSIMVNNDIRKAKFRFHELDLDDFLQGLQSDGFVLESVGLVNVRSLLNSITVCGFKNQRGYAYVVFYFDESEGCMMMDVLSSYKRVHSFTYGGTSIFMMDVNMNNFGEITTLIRGFDLENFHEYRLLEVR